MPTGLSFFSWQRSLRSALVLYVVLPLAAVIAITSALLLYAFQSRVEERLEEDVELIARALEIPVAQAIELGRVDGLWGALQSATGINRVYGAYVYDLNGETVASTGPVNYSTDSNRLADLAVSGDRQGRYDEVSGRRVYSYFVPLNTRSGVPMGLLHVTRRERDIRSSVVDLRLQMLLLSAVAVLCVGGLVLYGHGESIGRSLDEIRDSMRRVEEGDRSHRAPETGPRELAELATGLNAMLDSVEEAEEEVQSSREEQHVLRDRLRQAEKLAAIGTLAAGVAHELGTPLSVIDGKSQRLRRRTDLADDVERDLEDVSREVRRLEHIIRQLLDFGRRYDPAYRSVSAEGLVTAAVRALEDEAERSGVSVNVERHGDARKVDVDPLRIEQALTNLVRNAIDATPGGRVSVSWDAQPDEVRFVVDDDGAGIPEDVRDRLFEPFFTTKEVGKGTGLGLAVVHGIAEEHGGEVAVADSKLGGARFVLRLPTVHFQEGRPS